MKTPGTILAFGIVIAVFAALLAPKVLHVRKLEERSAALEAEVRKIRIENKDLERNLQLLREDPTYLEKVAREKFNKAKQGEIVYKVVRDETP